LFLLSVEIKIKSIKFAKSWVPWVTSKGENNDSERVFETI